MAVIPADLLMGQPGGTHIPPSRAEHIGAARATGGTETSKYPEEQKSNEIPLVVASERGSRSNRQTLRRWRGCRASHRAVTKPRGSGTAWEGRRDRVRAPYANPRGLPTGS